MSSKKTRYEGDIKPLVNTTPFYMVIVEESLYPPKVKYETYEEAFQEALKQSKRFNVKAYVMGSVTQIEQIPNVTQFK